MSPRARIDAFHAATVPWLEEVERSRMVQGKGRTLRTSLDRRLGDQNLEELLQLMHPGERWLCDLAAGAEPGPGRWVGKSLVISEGASVPRPHGDAGHFFLSMMFRPQPGGEVYVSPTAFYFMVFNHKLHKFEHRFDQQVADLPVEKVGKGLFQNYLMNAYQFYEMTWQSNRAPW